MPMSARARRCASCVHRCENVSARPCVYVVRSDVKTEETDRESDTIYTRWFRSLAFESCQCILRCKNKIAEMHVFYINGISRRNVRRSSNERGSKNQ